MPEPLLTFDCYDDFIRAASLSEDRVSTLFNILKKLPKVNYDLMERLVFHLARYIKLLFFTFIKTVYNGIEGISNKCIFSLSANFFT